MHILTKLFFLFTVYCSAIYSTSTICVAQDIQKNQIPLKKDLIEKIKNALQFNTFQARFLQETLNGSQEGSLYIKKPGKMRLAYDPPCPLLLIARQGWLIHYNLQTGAKEQLLVEDTPAAFLLNTNTDFDKKFLIKSVQQSPGLLKIDIESESLENLDTALTLVFETHPFALKQWIVTDSSSYQTKVTLFNWVIDIPLADSLFNSPAKTMNNFKRTV